MGLYILLKQSPDSKELLALKNCKMQFTILLFTQKEFKLTNPYEILFLILLYRKSNDNSFISKLNPNFFDIINSINTS